MSTEGEEGGNTSKVLLIEHFTVKNLQHPIILQKYPLGWYSDTDFSFIFYIIIVPEDCVCVRTCTIHSCDLYVHVFKLPNEHVYLDELYS